MEAGIVDRIEGEWAIVFLPDQARHVDIRLADLPDGLTEGDHLRIELQAGRVGRVEIDPDAKAVAEQRIQAKLDRLRRGDHLHLEEDSEGDT